MNQGKVHQINPLPAQRERKTSTRSAWAKRATIVLPLLCLLIFGTVIGANLLSSAINANAASLVPITGHVPALVKTSQLVGSTDANQSISLSIGLKLRNEDSLKSYVNSMSRANSITKKHLTPAEIAAAYAPLASSQQSVITYLQGYGFHVTKTLSQHLVISIQGTVGDAENAFHIQINNYRSSKGQNFYAPASEPEMPASLATLVQNIAGLSNTVHFTHPPTKQQPKSTAKFSANSVTCLGPGSNYFLPSQFATAYNLNGFYNAGFHGEGQNVALIEFDNFNISDVNNYSSCYGGANTPINEILVDGGNNGNNAAPGPGAIEVELDMELILSAAPKLGSLNVYEAPNSSAGSNDMWAQIINNDAVPVVSTSWGQCEINALSSDVQEENSLFTIAAAQGQTIVASAGDEGTNDCQTFLPPNGNPQKSVDDPASQPFITGVGGTTLAINSDNTYKSETVWNNGVETVDSNNDQLVIAGGGGISQNWPMSSWQQGPGVNNSFTSGTPCKAPSGSNCREVPDVSLNADPNNGGGYLIFCTVAAAGCTDSNNDTFFIVGGTSAAAPMWAAFMALTNEKTLKDGGFNVGFMNPFLYQIDQNAGGTSYSNDFHDVSVGNNDGLNDNAAVYPATADYDMASGLGSYNAWNLGQDLEKLANAKNGSRNAPANTTWYFAEGSVGGGFTEYLTLLNPSASQTATVNVQYLFENQAAVTKTYTVAASTRFTAHVNDDLGVAPGAAQQQAISAIVTSNVPIVAERPIYFNRPNDLGASGTDVLGATSTTNTSFYFAYSDTNQTSTDKSRDYITVLNPSSSQTANLTATLFSNGTAVKQIPLSVAPLHRGTIAVGDTFQGQASIQVTSSIGVVVERPIYSTVNVPTAGGTISGAASTVAATTPGDDWLFAEGHTADQFQENVALANFGTSVSTATVKLEYTNGTVQTLTVPVNGQSQAFVDVNNAFLHPNCGSSCTPTSDVSVEVTSTAPIVAERVMFFHYKGIIQGLTDVVGQAGPASHGTYSFAEGFTTNSFEEWLTLQNPNASSEVVAITLFFDGTIVQKEITLPAHSRTTLNINDIVVPIATAYPSATGFEVSMDVQVLGSGTVVAERPLYFNYLGQSQGASDIIGYTGG